MAPYIPRRTGSEIEAYSPLLWPGPWCGLRTADPRQLFFLLGEVGSAPLNDYFLYLLLFSCPTSPSSHAHHDFLDTSGVTRGQVTPFAWEARWGYWLPWQASPFSTSGCSGFRSAGGFTTAPKSAKGREHAWHRKQRRSRTRSRTLLRGWTTGQHQAGKGAKYLVFPKAEMWNRAQVSPWCDWCRCWSKKNAAFCQGCGWPVTPVEVTDTPPSPRTRAVYQHGQDAVPWSGNAWQPWRRDPSPGRPPSRKRNAEDQQAPKGGNKGGGKGKAKAQTKGIADLPDLSQLPQPPSAQVMVPARIPPSQSQSSGGSEDQKVLHSLLNALAKAESLPEDVKMIAAQAQYNHAQQEGKTLHKLVALRTEAKKNLEQLETQRTAYEKYWSEYVAQLFELVEKQLQDKEASLTKMQKSKSWLEQLADASRQLKLIPDSTAVSQLGEGDMELEDTFTVEKESELEAAGHKKDCEKHDRLRKALAAA